MVLTSALNEDLERLSSRHAFKVFLDGFLRNRRGYRMGVPAIALSELYSSRILEQCSLRLGTLSRRWSSGRQVSRLRLRDGEGTADFYISTLPPDALCNLLPDGIDGRRLRSCEPGMVPHHRDSPVVRQPITGLEHAAIVGRTIQWVFNRSAIGSSRTRAAVHSTRGQRVAL